MSACTCLDGLTVEGSQPKRLWSLLDAHGTTVNVEVYHTGITMISVDYIDPHDASIARAGKVVAAWRDRLRRWAPRRTEHHLDDLLRHLHRRHREGRAQHGKHANPASYPRLAQALSTALDRSLVESVRLVERKQNNPEPPRRLSARALFDRGTAEDHDYAIKACGAVVAGVVLGWLKEVVVAFADDEAEAEEELRLGLARVLSGADSVFRDGYTVVVDERLRNEVNLWARSSSGKATAADVGPSVVQVARDRDAGSALFRRVYLDPEIDAIEASLAAQDGRGSDE